MAIKRTEIVRGQKRLLILDGVEPLQYPQGPMQGGLKSAFLLALRLDLQA